MSEPTRPHESRTGETDPTGVQELLSHLRAPADIPPELVERIQASLRDEQRSRDQQRDTPPYALFAGRSGRPGIRGILLAGAGVTGCALLVAGTAILPDHIPGLMSQLSRTPAHANASVERTPHAPTAARGAAHIRSSSTQYTVSRLTQQAATLRDVTGPAEKEMAGQGTAALRPGSLTTSAGLASCLNALGLPKDALAWVDVAEYEDTPAAIIITREGDADRVRVVSLTCQEGDPGLRAGPLPL